jgi:hypothetical protein
MKVEIIRQGEFAHKSGFKSAAKVTVVKVEVKRSSKAKEVKHG